MKRILSLAMLFIVIACGKNTKENETPEPCSVPPPVFRLFVAKSAPGHQDFLNNKGEADEENVYFYQIIGNDTEKNTILLYLLIILTAKNML